MFRWGYKPNKKKKKQKYKLGTAPPPLFLWRFLLYAAALSVGVFGAQTQFGLVILQVLQLLGIQCSTTLLSYEVHRIFILHSTLNERQGHQHRSSSQTSNTMHSHTAAGLVSKLRLQQVQPIVNHLVWGRRPIVKRPIQNMYAFLFHGGLIICSGTHSHQGVHSKCLQILNKPSQLCISGIVRDEESQAVIGDLYWSWPVHFETHKRFVWFFLKVEVKKSTVLQRME